MENASLKLELQFLANNTDFFIAFILKHLWSHILGFLKKLDLNYWFREEFFDFKILDT